MAVNEVSGKLKNVVGDIDPKLDHIVAGAADIYDEHAPFEINGHQYIAVSNPDPSANPRQEGWYEYNSTTVVPKALPTASQVGI